MEREQKITIVREMVDMALEGGWKGFYEGKDYFPVFIGYDTMFNIVLLTTLENSGESDPDLKTLLFDKEFMQCVFGNDSVMVYESSLGLYVYCENWRRVMIELIGLGTEEIFEKLEKEIL